MLLLLLYLVCLLEKVKKPVFCIISPLYNNLVVINSNLVLFVVLFIDPCCFYKLLKWIPDVSN